MAGAAIAQLPTGWRDDLLVTVDAAGASRALVDHLTTLNTARRGEGSYGRRGRRVEYSVGWPVDARTRTAIEALREPDWTTALRADGTPDIGLDGQTRAQVVDLTGLLRHAVVHDEAGGKGDVDLLEGWPVDLRVIAGRTPREPNEQAELGQDAHWRYGASLAAADRAGRRPGQRRTQGVAVPAAIGPGPTGHPRPPQDREGPTRLGLGPGTGHRLGPDPRPAPRLNPHPVPTTRIRPARGTGAHPSTSGTPLRAHRAAISGHDQR